MRISVAADELTGVAASLPGELRRRGHEPILHGAYAEGERADWAWASEAAARDVAEGRADQAVVACWTGTGASIAANKVPGIRAALCGDAATAEGARRWNDANVLALSLRATSAPLGLEILTAFLETPPSSDDADRRSIAAVEPNRTYEQSASAGRPFTSTDSYLEEALDQSNHGRRGRCGTCRMSRHPCARTNDVVSRADVA